MPWLSWIQAFSRRKAGLLAPSLPLTLGTVAMIKTFEAEEASFYRTVEYEALLDWARMGRFILALAGSDRDELILLCLQSPAEISEEIERLPLVAAGLATVDIRPVMSLRLGDPVDSRPN